MIGFAVLIGTALAADIALPPEITIHPTPPGPAFADVNGLTLYVFDRDEEPNVSMCTGDCATAWPPVRASTDAKPFGDWTLVPRTDGAPQWTYRGKPLYRYALEQKPGMAFGDGGGEWNLALASWQFLQRNTGRAAAGAKEEALSFPPAPGGITAQKSAQGAVYADHLGMTLYVSDADCGSTCGTEWLPLAAPMAAHAVGDWTIKSRQWAYLGKPVYRCAKDQAKGETTCDLGALGPWRAIKVD
ncbi:MAG: hypothetical protein FJX59_10210 [Alphaproteobacteria bacterium]|nr:hypothetical protein [Alphaproteobacteria bacterium]